APVVSTLVDAQLGNSRRRATARSALGTMALSGLDAEQYQAEFEHRVRWNGVRYTGVPVRKVRTDPDPALAAFAHPFDAVLETGNNAALSDSKRRPLVLLDAVASVEEEAVLHIDRASALGERASAQLQVFVLHAAAGSLHETRLATRPFRPLRRVELGCLGSAQPRDARDQPGRDRLVEGKADGPLAVHQTGQLFPEHPFDPRGRRIDRVMVP